MKKKYICGVDEAGRGPLAGPVTAAAVIIGENFPREILNDSKKMSPKKRKEASLIIREKALHYSLGWAWPEEIDTFNIHRATLLAMYRAMKYFPFKPVKILVDGLFTPHSPYPIEAVVKGDSKHPEIMAASIMAKTIRDQWMEWYSYIEPRYEFEKHKGYPTVRHRELVRMYGLSPIHRRSFRISFS